jgi:hypothetical protein
MEAAASAAVPATSAPRSSSGGQEGKGEEEEEGALEFEREERMAGPRGSTLQRTSLRLQ